MPRLGRKLNFEIWRRPAWLALVICLGLNTGHLAAQTARIGTVDFYGLRTVPEDTVRSILSLQKGDLPPSQAERAAIERRLRAIPGVMAAQLRTPCCEDGRVNLYVGIAEDSAAFLEFRPPPAGSARLPDEILATGEEFERAMVRAVLSGNAREDNSQGHSLMADSAARSVQEWFLIYAERDLDMLREVLRTSSDAEHRALAAQILGYAPDKLAVIDDLMYGVRDPEEGVRNGATRALFAIAYFANLNPELGIRLPVAPFIRMLNSFSWSDRNKGTGMLLLLTEDRDPEILRQVRERALEALEEMARWKGQHGWMAFMILGRVAGLAEEELSEARGSREKREQLVDEAIEAIRGEGAPGGSLRRDGNERIVERVSLHGTG